MATKVSTQFSRGAALGKVKRLQYLIESFSATPPPCLTNLSRFSLPRAMCTGCKQRSAGFSHKKFSRRSRQVKQVVSEFQ